MRRSFVLPALAACSLLACQSSTGNEADADALLAGSQHGVSVRIDSLGGPQAGAPGFSRQVYVTITNTGTSAVGVIRCDDHDLASAELEKPAGEAWEGVGGGMCSLALYAGPMVLAPGAKARAQLHSSSPGTFRVAVRYFSPAEETDVGLKAISAEVELR